MKLTRQTSGLVTCISPSRGAVRYNSSSSQQGSGRGESSPAKPSRAKDRSRQIDRDLLVDVLSSSATKRDAKSYISRFITKSPSGNTSDARSREHALKNEVNLGRLFRPSREFARYDQASFASGEAAPFSLNVRAAIIVIRSVSSISKATLHGVGRTLAQLSRLGLNCAVIVDDDNYNPSNRSVVLTQQLERVVDSIEVDGGVRARRLDRLFLSRNPKDPKTVGIEDRKLDLLYRALQQDAVTVASPLVYSQSGKMVGINANGAALSLAYSLSRGRSSRSQPETANASHAADGASVVSLDRLIVIDPRGGIPNVSIGGSHVFINLEQEFDLISKDLHALLLGKDDLKAVDAFAGEMEDKAEISAAAASLSRSDIGAHLDNLSLLRGALAVLPSTSSGLIVTPAAASFSAKVPVEGVGTRSQRNPLIHNLLTDKPLFSSSLPRKRLSTSDMGDVPTNHPLMTHAPPTHFKHGMPVIIEPDPSSKPWTAPRDVTYSLSLDDPRVDQKRLVELIEDSFGRRLDTEAYFARIRERLAGIIIAGNYEGGAILTWEQPRSYFSSTSTGRVNNPELLVPYLDKFAVLKRAQGGGVADVVFSAMVRRCFPQGVCWRSRNGNPVNKWYFDRARGAYKLPVQKGEQAWTMFWTTENLQPRRFEEYAEISLAVKSSWADGGKALD